LPTNDQRSGRLAGTQRRVHRIMLLYMQQLSAMYAQTLST
jgi:hypothetical protein